MERKRMSTLTRQTANVALADRLEELVTCAVCLKLLNNPKVFPCLHSYCLECIEKLAERETGLECPECRAPVEIGNPPDLSILPTNFFANNVLATLSLRERDDNDAPALVCDNCEDPQQPVENRCRECLQFLCAPCAESHQRSCDTKGHVLVSKDELKTNEPAENARAVKCSKHNEIIKFYCDTCQETTCMVCTVIDNKQHNMVSVEQSAAEAKEEVQNLVRKVEERVETVSAGIALSLQKSQDINAREEACSAQIETFFTKLHAEIEAEKQNMLAITASAAEGQQSQIDASKNVLKLALSTCQNGVKFAKQTLENGNDVQLLDIKPTITQYLVNLKSVQNETIPDIGNPVRFLKMQSLTEICQRLTTFMCSVEEVAVCPEKCEAKVGGDSMLKVGKKSVIIIVCKDKDGRSISSGAGKELFEPRFTGVALDDVDISENQDGTHEISFVVKELGTLQFETKINGRGAPGCSLKVDVKWELSDVHGSGYLRTCGQIVDCISGEGDVGKYSFRMGDTPMTSGRHHWKVEVNHAVQNVDECVPEGPMFEVGVIEASDDYTETSIKNGTTKKWVYGGPAKKIVNVFLNLDMEKRIWKFCLGEEFYLLHRSLVFERELLSWVQMLCFRFSL